MSEDKKNTFQKIAGDKGSKRMLFFIGGIVVVIFALIFFLGGGESAEGTESSLRGAPNQRDDIIQGEVSENYERALREADRQRIEQATDEGRSALPSIIGSSVQDEDEIDISVDEKEEPVIIRPDVQKQEKVQPVALPEETAPAEPVADPRPIIRPRETRSERPTVQSRPQSGNGGPQQQQEPQLVERPRPQTDETLRSLYAQQMARIMQSMDSRPGSPTTQYFYQPGTGSSRAASAGNGAASSAGAMSSGSGGNLPPAILRSRSEAGSASRDSGSASMQAAATQAGIAASGEAGGNSGSAAAGQQMPFDMPMPGEIIYATMVTRADSDAPGPVVAKILQGDLAGARLIGNFSVANEKLMLEFTTMSVDETMTGTAVNKTYGVSAVAVDTQHVGTGIATSVDRHLISRIAVKASTAFLSGLGSAISASGKVVNSLGEGQTETETPERSLKTNALIAGGEAAKETGTIIDQYLGDKPTTIRVESGTPLGILFLQ